MSGAAPFDPATWIDDWCKVGSVVIERAAVSIQMDLNGNVTAQQSLLSKLDSVRGRRDLVRDAALDRWAA